MTKREMRRRNEYEIFTEELRNFSELAVGSEFETSEKFKCTDRVGSG